ncbi:hypothetical protein E2C01_097585 [Portunus trituberculatus]|uniref:Uncharacterized protein n=1 Tax=Portunus trituberculatus TaxID=210409 RepID=A0A5B7K4T7_PORTR|nr:hypothetical protein [Portunus trituberculatus]
MRQGRQTTPLYPPSAPQALASISPRALLTRVILVVMRCDGDGGDGEAPRYPRLDISDGEEENHQLAHRCKARELQPGIFV